MKKTSVRKSRRSDPDGPRPEYKSDYAKSRPNRFVGRKKERTVVVLEPDVSRVFTTPESVNKALRAMISAMPKGKSKPIRESVHK